MSATSAANTVREEIAIGRRHAPAVAWPTLILLVAVAAGLCVTIRLATGGEIAYWHAAAINTVIFYGTYTIVHEGVHDNIVPHGRLRWINMIAAFIAAAPLWLLIYPHRKSHMVHHTRCNTDEDPDIYARGDFGVVTFWRIPLAILGQLNPLEQYHQCRHYNVPRGETIASMATLAAYYAFCAIVIYAGYGYELVMFWLLPFFVGYDLMLVFFTWVPHHPHTLTGRYHDTRCSLWRGGNLLTQGQNYHLIHHMMPWVPWYRYETVFHEIEPQLRHHGALIDGFWPRPVEQSVAAFKDWEARNRPTAEQTAQQT